MVAQDFQQPGRAHENGDIKAGNLHFKRSAREGPLVRGRATSGARSKADGSTGGDGGVQRGAQCGIGYRARRGFPGSSVTLRGSRAAGLPVHRTFDADAMSDSRWTPRSKSSMASSYLPSSAFASLRPKYAAASSGSRRIARL